MGKVWVLDTETKGTGAQMVPLEQVLAKPKAPAKPLVAPGTRRAPAPAEPEPRVARRFRIVDVMTREVLADDVGGREALAALADVASPVDVHVYVWAPKAERWRLLTLAEKRAVWERRAAQPAAT
jgi:hypothetical protein